MFLTSSFAIDVSDIKVPNKYPSFLFDILVIILEFFSTILRTSCSKFTKNLPTKSNHNQYPSYSNFNVVFLQVYSICISIRLIKKTIVCLGILRKYVIISDLISKYFDSFFDKKNYQKLLYYSHWFSVQSVSKDRYE